MTDEDIVDCIMDIDKILEELQDALEAKKYKLALNKCREARDAVEDLRQDDCADDTKEVEMNVMNNLK